MSTKLILAFAYIIIEPGYSLMSDNTDSILIRGGTIVNDDRMFNGDVYISGGKIRQVSRTVNEPFASRVIDASGKYVIPGGIDPHVHFDIPPTRLSTDFYYGTRAALAGGTTMIIDFAGSYDNSSLINVYNKFRQMADRDVCCDYGLHAAIAPRHTEYLEEQLSSLINSGVSSFKIFLGYPGVLMLNNTQIYQVMKIASKLRALVLVHVETGELTQQLTDEFLQNKRFRPIEIHYHAHPEKSENNAATRAKMMADLANCPVYLVHLYSSKSAETVNKARKNGQVVFGETVAIALAKDAADCMFSCDWEKNKRCVASPTLLKYQREELIKALAYDGLQVVGTDNFDLNVSETEGGQTNYAKLQPTINGVEERMCVVWGKGVKSGIMSPMRFVAVTSANAAKIFNIYPRKGRIAVGSDADVVVWNGDASRTISAKTHHYNSDFNTLEGETCHGVPEYVISRGKVVVDNGQVNVVRGSGRFVRINNRNPYLYSTLEHKIKNQKVTKQCPDDS